MNNLTAAGRIVADAKTDATPNGTPTCKFRLASDVGWGDNKDTLWLNCTGFGERWTKLAPYLKKGAPVTVFGTLRPARIYQDQSDETRIAQDLTVQEIALQGAKGDGAGATGQSQTTAAPAPQNGSHGAQGTHGTYVARERAAPVSAPPSFDEADDIPF
jgi:single-strand DNA-binding protein